MKYENFNSPKISFLEKQISRMLIEWKEMIEDAGLTEEYKELFKDTLDKAPLNLVNDKSLITKGDEVSGTYQSLRYVLIDGLQRHFSDALAAIAKNNRTGEKIDVRQDKLDAANLYNLLIEDTHIKEQQLNEN